MKHIQAAHHFHPSAQGAEHTDKAQDTPLRKLETIRGGAEHGLGKAEKIHQPTCVQRKVVSGSKRAGMKTTVQKTTVLWPTVMAMVTFSQSRLAISKAFQQKALPVNPPFPSFPVSMGDTHTVTPHQKTFLSKPQPTVGWCPSFNSNLIFCCCFLFFPGDDTARAAVVKR